MLDPRDHEDQRRGLPCSYRANALTLCIASVSLFGVTSLAGADWPIWLGPNQDGTFHEPGWLKEWPDGGPPRVFTKPIGEGYSSVSVAEGILVLFHRIGDQLHIDALDPLDGERKWRYSYPTDYRDRYQYSGGPRCCPLIDVHVQPRRVYTLGSKGVMTCLELDSGRKIWQRDLQAEYEIQPNFFGVGAAPTLYKESIIVNLGGTDPGTGMTLALDKTSGAEKWKSPTGGGGYAAARVAAIYGLDHLLIFHRTGMTSFDPADGAPRWEFPWYSRDYESVNAATPVVVGDHVFFSATYGTGGVLLRVKSGGDGSEYETVWKDDLRSREKILDTHWSTAIHVDGYLYGFAGRHEGSATLRCVELKSGQVKWSWRSYLGRGVLLHSEGHFIALGERGDLSLFKLTPMGYEEMRRIPRVLKWPAWSVPTVAQGLLYLRDEEKLVCLDLRSPTRAGSPEKGRDTQPSKERAEQPAAPTAPNATPADS